MKFIISELFAAADIKVEKILKVLVIGIVCLAAIAKCGFAAVLIIALLALTKMGIDN